MSRIGKKIIDVPEGVNVAISESEILTSGPKGELSCENFSVMAFQTNHCR